VSTRKRNIFAHNSGVVKTKSHRNENEYDRTATFRSHVVVFELETEVGSRR